MKLVDKATLNTFVWFPTRGPEPAARQEHKFNKHKAFVLGELVKVLLLSFNSSFDTQLWKLMFVWWLWFTSSGTWKKNTQTDKYQQTEVSSTLSNRCSAEIVNNNQINMFSVWNVQQRLNKSSSKNMVHVWISFFSNKAATNHSFHYWSFCWSIFSMNQQIVWSLNCTTDILTTWSWEYLCTFTADTLTT